MSNLTFGTDPEYFITEMENDREYAVPVPYFIEKLGVPEIGYDETRKHPVLLKEKNFKIIMDGVAAEFTVPPVKTPVEFYQNIQDGLGALKDFSNSFGYNVSVKPTVYYDFMKWYDPEIKSLDWCGIFGCDADKDAIVEEYNSPEVNVKDHVYRYGGGHFHISDNNELIKDLPVPYIRLLATTCGNYFIANSKYEDLEKLRMFKYGQPGRFRVQNYPDGNIGVEYRSPSNYWTTDLNMIEGMFYWAEKAYDLLKNVDRAVKVLETYLDLTTVSIQNVDKQQSQYILDQVEKM